MTIRRDATNLRPSPSWGRLLDSRRNLLALDATWSLADAAPRLHLEATTA